MKKITDSYLKTHLKHALAQLVPERAEIIWKMPIEKASGEEWYLDGVRKPKRHMGKVISIMTATVAACLVICLMSVHMLSQRISATIYLDVNPSVEFQINQKEKVLQATANNQDGETILEDMDLRHTDLNVALNAVLGSMVKHGYLSEAQNMVLLSVDSKNPQNANALCNRLSGEIESCLDSLLGTGTVFGQEVQVDDKLIALAEKYDMTPGKAFLLQSLMEANPKLNYETMSDIPLHQLPSYLNEEGMKLQDYVYITGNQDVLDDDTAEETEVKASEVEEELREETEEDAAEAREEAKEKAEETAEKLEEASEKKPERVPESEIVQQEPDANYDDTNDGSIENYSSDDLEDNDPIVSNEVIEASDDYDDNDSSVSASSDDFSSDDEASSLDEENDDSDDSEDD
ncbi:anti-sigma-I factor RsgI family protein [Parablautia sp. Marseille-Q6255]|uniref:anti-sigma-I factor RsgI family protein n=1 Tax=Parablautia sp. Marseille-Q6255 TaxID=3039593 RepID=UPI0024BD3CC2|nr:hypothetical protein [Parablautia sp. Marseille-Q6255]